MADKYMFEIDDGTKEYVFKNKFNQEIGKIHFRGGDISIIDRYNSLLNDFDSIVAPLVGVNLKDDGTVSDDGSSKFDEGWKVIKGVEAELIKRINAIFDSDDAENLFAKRNAFSTINGVFYVEKVIQALGNIVAQEMSEETAKSQKRFDKYTKDIEKGKIKDSDIE